MCMNDDFYTDFKRLHPKVQFHFPAIPSLPDYTFESLDSTNFDQLYGLFANDASPFVDSRFKTYDGAKEYAKELSFCGAYMPKHGGHDWLFKTSTEYAGILHLYDLSKETFAQNHKRAWIGFATKASFRGQHKTLAVVKHFINSIFVLYPHINFIHAATAVDNIISQNFLIKLGFIVDTQERLSKEETFYFFHRLD